MKRFKYLDEVYIINTEEHFFKNVSFFVVHEYCEYGEYIYTLVPTGVRKNLVPKYSINRSAKELEYASEYRKKRTSTI